MDENYKKILLTKYPDDSEAVQTLYGIFKDMDYIRPLIERINECLDEKQLVSHVLVDLYINGRMREQLNSSTFIELLLKFNDNPMKVRSVQRYIRDIFDSSEVKTARKRAEQQRYIDYVKSQEENDKGHNVSITFKIGRLSDLQFDSILSVAASMSAEYVKIEAGGKNIGASTPLGNILEMNLDYPAFSEDASMKVYIIATVTYAMFEIVCSKKTFCEFRIE